MKLGKVLGSLLGTAALVGGVGALLQSEKKNTEKQKLYRSRYEAYYEVTTQWLFNKNAGKSCDAFLREHHYNKIAIYGMGTLGELFYQELKDCNIEIAYMVDKSQENSVSEDGIAIVGIDAIKDQEAVDAMIVTPVFDFGAICSDLENCGVECDIISLEDVIFGI